MCLLLHVDVVVGKIVFEHVVGGSVGNRSESEGGLHRGGVVQPFVVHAN